MKASPSPITVRSCDERDRAWMAARLDEAWGGRWQARAGSVHDVSVLPGVVALDGSDPVGFATYRIEGPSAELAVLEALRRTAGIGTLLIEAVVAATRADEATELWAVTTNDNLEALGFYQRRGFKLRALRVGAVDEARRALKPNIPSEGHGGIPIHDELELVRPL